MANGSFGLSGFPTAPTTTAGAGGGANNPTSSVTTSVLSTSGFDAGELIYQRNNDFGAVPDNAVATATFPLNGTAVVMGGAVMDQARTGNTTNLGVYGQAYRSQNVAKLSDGNIVIVFKAVSTSTATGWATTANCAHFKIVTEDGATVVDTTCIDTVNTVNTSTISVIGLSTGGFVIAYRNTSNQIRYGIYSNTGSVTTALQNDTTSSNVAADSTILMGARSDGNWVIAYQNLNPSMLAKVFSNTGVQVYAWLSTGLGVSQSANRTKMVVRSDNTVVLFTQSNLGSSYYAVLSTTNTLTVGATYFLNAGGSNTPSNSSTDACLLPNGNVVFCAVATGFIITHLLSPTNVLTLGVGYVSVPQNNDYSGPICIIGKSDNGFLAVFVGITAGATSLTAVAVAPTYGSATSVVGLPYLGYSSVANFPVLVDTGTYIGVYYTTFVASTNLNNMNLTRFSKTTFQVVNYTDASFSVGTTTAAVNGYERSASTPTSASFLAATTTTTSATIPKTSGTFPTPIQIGTGLLEVDSTVFSDGRFGFICRTNAGAVNAFIYTSTGTLITTINVATGVSTQTTYSCRMVELGNGKIAMSYIGATNTTVTIAVYSAAYAPLGTTTFSVATLGAFNGVHIAAVPGSRILVSYTNTSNYPAFRVFSDTLTTLTNEVVVTTAIQSGQVVCAAVDNGILIAFSQLSSSSQFYGFFESAPNVWTFVSSVGMGGSGHPYGGNKMSYRTGNGFYVIANNTDGSQMTTISLNGVNGSAATSCYSVSNTINNGNSSFASCFTALGFQAYVWRTNATTVGLYSRATSTSYSNPSAVNLTISTATNSNYILTPFVGNKVIFSYSNGSGTYFYTILDVGPTAYSATLTAGTVSQPALTLSPATGYTLIGVSTTAAPENGTGTVQINGPATLNSQYPETLNQAFDFQNPVTFGVQGIVNGRNVNLQGNV